ncbi:uncharacterized protein Z520_06972 [Fonsecaea multimorphosa CBS 102226]|uniref:Vacuolar protein sorting-associated protein 62 n=1 Tax=Fonsecaea multimorphosa CBS 102226 TaxID=1442371 RepID=A0A0D2H6N6_9EURO|nr:uncharacterized protein Z520_06972 [Fonsecaea multimorphosa CBS 102226]KIX97520.1 hypothetical protein Z520_06972 [Fonsecaea multimorphosa CBS 102226]OAL23481.1 hypothetical protein AYO22_06531 [Fonsecaea multimorphosa]
MNGALNPCRHSQDYHLTFFSIISWALLLEIQLVSAYTIPQYVIDYAPVVWLHSTDPYMPSDILTHVLHTAPRVGFEPITEALPLPNLENLSLLNGFGKEGTDVFLTAVDDVASFPDWVFGEVPDVTGTLHNSTACAVVVVESEKKKGKKGDGEKVVVLDAFYFYFYSWNEGADILQVVPPLNKLFPDSKPGDHYGNHLGDWEHNMIRFENGKPTGIYFSHHTSGEACRWDNDACLSKPGERPVVFSARGSHANYPSPGSHVHDEALIDIADKGRMWDPVKLAYFYHYDPQTETFTAADPGTDPTDWLAFNGNWGDKQYPDPDPRQETVPYFGLKKFNNGPNGPKFKHLVRKGLMPDVKEKPNLMKTLVHWYMGMYGCCLKGINPWVVIISLLLILAVSIALCVFTFKRVRPRLKAWILKKKGDESKDTSEVQLRLLDPDGAEAEDEPEV